jgi:hypothetical protein
MRHMTKITSGVVSAAMLLGAPAAFGQSTAVQGYSTPGGVVQTQIGHSPSHQTQPTASTQAAPSSPSAPAATPSATAKTSGNKLPFTGLDVALIVAAGGVLVAMGYGLRRISRTDLA